MTANVPPQPENTRDPVRLIRIALEIANVVQLIAGAVIQLLGRRKSDRDRV